MRPTVLEIDPTGNVRIDGVPWPLDPARYPPEFRRVRSAVEKLQEGVLDQEIATALLTADTIRYTFRLLPCGLYLERARTGVRAFLTLTFEDTDQPDTPTWHALQEVWTSRSLRHVTRTAISGHRRVALLLPIDRTDYPAIADAVDSLIGHVVSVPGLARTLIGGPRTTSTSQA